MSLKTDLLGTSRAVFGATGSAFNPMLRGPAVTFAPEDDGGALSIDGALSLLREPAPAEDALDEDEEDADPDGEAQGEIEADDQAADGDDAPDEDDPASEEGPDEDEDEAPETPASDAPKFWSAEEKALFAKAPPEVQQLVAAKTAEAESRVYAAKEEAATARKEASTIAEVRQAVDQQLERVSQLFQGKWDGMTPETWAQWAKDAPDECFAAKLEFEAEQEELDRLKTAQAATEAEEHRQFIKAENEKLADPETGVPELVDPVKGKERKTELVSMLKASGFTPEDLKWIGARELKIAWEAMQWRQAKARLANKPKTPTPPAPKGEKKGGSVRPAAAPVQGPMKRRAVESAKSRFSETGSFDDALALMRAKRT